MVPFWAKPWSSLGVGQAALGLLQDMEEQQQEQGSLIQTDMFFWIKHKSVVIVVNIGSPDEKNCVVLWCFVGVDLI